MLPSKHNHAGKMIWSDTLAECSECKQAWYWDGKWVWLSPGRSAPQVVSDYDDPYAAFRSRYE